MKFNNGTKVRHALVIFLLSLKCFAEQPGASIQSSLYCDINSAHKVKLNENLYVQIGGIKQWIIIKGSDCSNPLLLIVHGGPGNPLSLYHESLFRKWESEFTIVHWDQRGAGRTYEANQKVGELSVEQLTERALTIDLLVSDGLEVTDYIRKRFNQEKMIISGSSWGSVLATKMVFTSPEKYYFYVGLSQLVNYEKNIKESYDLVLSIAEKKRDQNAISILNSLSSPPWKNPRNFGKLRRIIRDYEYRVVSELPELNVGKEYLSDLTRAAYFAGEEFSFVKFVGLNGDGMAQKIALDKCCTKFKIPVYILQGENDLLTVAKVTEEYFEIISAPKKEYIKLKKSGHDPNIKMLDKQLEVLRKAVRDLANK